MVVQVQANHFQHKFSITIQLSKRRKKCIFINLWQAYMHNYFYFKNKRKVLILFLLSLRELPKKQDFFILISSKLPMLEMLQFLKDYFKDSSIIKWYYQQLQIDLQKIYIRMGIRDNSLSHSLISLTKTVQSESNYNYIQHKFN